MGYDIHIERDPPLTLDEWKAAVQSTEGVRLDSSNISMTLPDTKKVLSINGWDGDAHIYYRERWVPCFRWQQCGSVTFGAGMNFEDSEDIVRKVSSELAAKLNAQLRGDGGERYD